RLDLFVGVDSGPAALAAAAGTPAVVLDALYYQFERPPWGALPGDEIVSAVVARDDGVHRWYGDCRLASLRRERSCVNPACIGRGVMGEIAVEAVIRAVEARLAGTPRTGAPAVLIRGPA